MCIPREDMPQVDLEVYPDLFVFLKARFNIQAARANFDPYTLQIRQCVSETRPATSALSRQKLILVARGLEVLDGNSRVLMWRKLGKFAPCLVLDTWFDKAKEAMLAYEGTYTLKDFPDKSRRH